MKTPGAFDWPADAQLGDLPGGGNVYDRGQRVQPPRLAGAVAHFITEALLAARDDDDALLGDLADVRPTSDGVELTIAGQRLHVIVRPTLPGVYAR